MHIPSRIPVVPMRNTVVFPNTSIPIVIGRPQSVAALKATQNTENLVVVVTQRNPDITEPKLNDIFSTGTLCQIENVANTENNSFQVVISGLFRFQIHQLDYENGYAVATGTTVPDQMGASSEKTQVLFSNLKILSKEIIGLLPVAQDSVTRLIDRMEDPSHLVNLCASYLNLSIAQKQSLLENVRLESRLETMLGLLQKEREALLLQKDIQEKMSGRLNKSHRDALLREQMRTIREELGEEGGELKDELGKKLEQAELPPEVKKIANEELARLENLPAASSEYHVIRTYLDWLASMPWNKMTDDVLDLQKAKQVLDEDHYGLDSVKKRILQYLSVAKLKNRNNEQGNKRPEFKGPILCLVGPPGVGKTSIGQSIAKALGKKFIRTSLGGVRDEAEIRGHRRTYIGAMPGRIIQNIKRAGVKNPLFMLDEIDKLSNSFHGDPASAMLELLDPEQNKTFTDHYLDVAFDVSNCFFVATANVVDTIPAPLRDRMEIIEITGYTVAEKLNIAKKYLLPKQMEENGLKASDLEIKDEDLEFMITHYTREAGVRNLQRKIGTVCRSVAEKIVLEKTDNKAVIVGREEIREALGLEKYHPEMTEHAPRPGVVTGLAWTPVGGDILFIESNSMPGKGNLILTGQLGDVMKESAQIAMSLVRSAAAQFAPGFEFDKKDIHIHVPAGAIPKDGPSAGVTILTSLASLLLNKTIDPKLAMTGEITLRGAVMPVGGIKEKILAAHRAGIERIILSKKNEPDLQDVPEEVRSQIKFQFAQSVEELFEAALGFREFKLFSTPFISDSSQKSLSCMGKNQGEVLS